MFGTLLLRTFALLVAPLDQIQKNDAAPKSAVGAGVSAEVHAGYDHFGTIKAAMTASYNTGLHDVALTGHAGSAEAAKPAGTSDVVRTGAPESSIKEAKVIVGIPPGEGKDSGDGGGFVQTEPGVFAPKDPSKFKTPTIEPYTTQDDRPMDENGHHSFDNSGVPNPDLPNDQAKTVVGSDGKVQSITSREARDDAGVTTKFSFDANGGVTRTVDEQKFDADGNALDTKEVVQFDSSGKPIARNVTLPGLPNPIPGNIDPNDKLTIQKDASGRITSVTSGDDKNNTKLTLDEQGNVTSRSITTPDQDKVTNFDSDGQANYNQTTDYDTDHNKTKTSTITPSETNEDTFDADGKVVKTETWSGQDDTHTSWEKQKDGTVVTAADQNDVHSLAVSSPDGTKTEFQNDENTDTKTTKITYPDGSSGVSIEDPHGFATVQTDKNGYWTAQKYQKDTGVVTRWTGGPGENPIDRMVDHPEESVPI
jgi:hypothetical protein